MLALMRDASVHTCIQLPRRDAALLQALLSWQDCSSGTRIEIALLLFNMLKLMIMGLAHSAVHTRLSMHMHACAVDRKHAACWPKGLFGTAVTVYPIGLRPALLQRALTMVDIDINMAIDFKFGTKFATHS